MRSRRMLYVTLLFLAGLAISARQAYYVGKWRRYENAKAGVVLEYPAAWFNVGPSKLPSWKYIVLLTMDFPIIDAIELRVYCDREDNPKRRKEMPFGEWLIHKNSRHVHVLSRRKASIGKNGYIGEEIFYEDKTFRGRIITLRHHGHVYAIEIHAVKKKWDEADAVFDIILETFEFLE